MASESKIETTCLPEAMILIIETLSPTLVLMRAELHKVREIA